MIQAILALLGQPQTRSPAKVEVLLDGEGGGLELRVVVQLLRHRAHEGAEGAPRREHGLRLQITDEQLTDAYK